MINFVWTRKVFNAWSCVSRCPESRGDKVQMRRVSAMRGCKRSTFSNVCTLVEEGVQARESKCPSVQLFWIVQLSSCAVFLVILDFRFNTLHFALALCTACQKCPVWKGSGNSQHSEDALCLRVSTIITQCACMSLRVSTIITQCAYVTTLCGCALNFPALWVSECEQYV